MNNDWRRIANGWEIPSENYCDQPYIVIAGDGAWVCAMTTGTGVEGEKGQHIIVIRSTDNGKSWSEPIDLEPADGPESSYSTLLKVPSGRIYCFYNHNTDNTRAVIADNPPYQDGLCRRVDSQGHFVFKYSDDHGKIWSQQRYEVPLRKFRIDRENPYGGNVKFFWNVGKAFIWSGCAYVPLTKVGGFGHGFFTRSEGALLKSENLLMEPDPEKIKWETLPDGDIGLKTPLNGGTIAEEHSICVLSDGSFCAVYRTIDGHPCEAYSRDSGHTWEAPRYRTFANGRLMRHPRAANFHWPLGDGTYLYWFHNHGGNWYDGRNPVFLCGGTEADGATGKEIRWSEPEILLYDDDPKVRVSYPDLVVEDGRYFVTETQKTTARVHEIPASFIKLLLTQQQRNTIAEGAAFEAVSGEHPIMPYIPSMVDGSGFAVEACLGTMSPVVLFDARDQYGKGIAMLLQKDGILEGILNDGCSESRIRSTAKIGEGGHAVWICDGGSKVMSFVINGCFDDGGDDRPYGWSRMGYYIDDINGARSAKIGGKETRIRFYNRLLLTGEAIGNYRVHLTLK